MPQNRPPNRRATLGGIFFVAVLLAFGIWVMNKMEDARKAQNCIESGGRRCAAIDTIR